MAADADPVLMAVERADYDDEPTTAEEEAGLVEARAAARRGDVLSTADLLRQMNQPRSTG